jgi:hypothetical protein
LIARAAAVSARLALALLVLSVVLFVPRSARAAGRRSRPLFEPTDLELEEPWTIEADVQLGLVQGGDGRRLVLPDFEVDLGLTPGIEVDLDGGYALEGPGSGPLAFDHPSPDSLWTAVKVGLVSLDGPAGGLGLGVQLGPKLPVASGSHGLGVEGLALLGLRRQRTHVVIDLGAFVDCSPAPGAPRPRGIEGGIDLDVDLDPGGRFSFTAELGGVRFISSDEPHQLVATAGVAFAPGPHLEISLVALAGVLAGGDRYGLLLGLSPKFSLLRGPR